jgi:hypothetical protein
MLADMDKDHDGKIDCAEYSKWWLEDTKRHLQVCD